MPSLKGQVAFNLEIHQILISLLIAGSVTARVLSLLGPSFPEGVVGPKAKVTLRRFFRQKEIHPRQTRARPGLSVWEGVIFGLSQSIRTPFITTK